MEAELCPGRSRGAHTSSQRSPRTPSWLRRVGVPRKDEEPRERNEGREAGRREKGREEKGTGGREKRRERGKNGGEREDAWKLEDPNF